MCLSEIYTDEDMNRIVEELPEVVPGVVVLQKIVQKEMGFFEVPFSNAYLRIKQRQYENGINIAEKNLLFAEASKAQYWSGFHFSQNVHFEQGEFPLVWRSRIIISCLVKKDWLQVAGKQWNRTWLVASQAFFPIYPDTEAKLEDFLAWQKENDPEYAEIQEVAS